MDCPLCTPSNEQTLWQDTLCRIILAEEEGYPGFCRVIWHDHVKEMTDLTPENRLHLLNIVLATESAIRRVMQPEKINLASLGNKVAHLHWHIIPRFSNDPHFPESVWSAIQRSSTTSCSSKFVQLKKAILEELQATELHTVSRDLKLTKACQTGTC